MSAGISLLLGVLLVVGVIYGVQAWMGHRVRALEGEGVPGLPEPYAIQARGSRLFWFHSPTCGPCRVMHPAIEQLEARGQATEIDVSRHFEVAKAFGILATPTTVKVLDGRVVAVRPGVLSLAQLEAL